MNTTTTDKLDQYRYVYDLPGDIREHTHEGDAVRWISVEPPSYEDVRRAEILRDYQARYLAEEVVGAADEDVLRWRRNDYLRARAEQQRINDLWERTCRSSNHPGALVMRGEWTRA